MIDKEKLYMGLTTEYAIKFNKHEHYAYRRYVEFASIRGLRLKSVEVTDYEIKLWSFKGKIVKFNFIDNHPPYLVFVNENLNITCGRCGY